MSGFDKPVRPGTIVVALGDIIEEGFMFPGEEWGHANEGDVGIVVFFDVSTRLPTVRFIKSGTATAVAPEEIRRVSIDNTNEADRIAKEFIEADRLSAGRELPDSCSLCKSLLNRASL
jgi:hypothetical protein